MKKPIEQQYKDAIKELLAAQAHYDRMVSTSTRDAITEAAERLSEAEAEARALCK